MRYILILILVVLNLRVFATTLTISVANYSFTPSNGSIHIGDTVKFVWVNGTHTISINPNKLPANASPLNVTLSSSNTQYLYIPKINGTYKYECTNHPNAVMTGNFQVDPPRGVRGAWPSFWVPDSSFTNTIHFNTQTPVPAGMIVYLDDNSGKKDLNPIKITSPSTDIDASSLPRGQYRLVVTTKGIIFPIYVVLKK